MFNNLELLAFILVLARYTWVCLGVINDGLCMLIRGLWDRDPAVKRDGCVSMAIGVCALWATYHIGIPLLLYWLSA